MIISIPDPSWIGSDGISNAKCDFCELDTEDCTCEEDDD